MRGVVSTENSMSRVGKKPIPIPEKTRITVVDGLVTAQGPLGELSLTIPDMFQVEQTDSDITLSVQRKKPNTAAHWGLYRSLLANVIEGVSNGFEKRLEIQGVGYRAAIQGKNLVLSLGYSHPITVEIPDDVTIELERQYIIIKGIDKQRVGQLAANIRAFRKPEPYKGKGIRYVGEFVRRKVGKRVVSG